MRTVTILVIAIAVTGLLMMRFRKRWLAKIDIAVMNRITNFVRRLASGVGRKSGKLYRTPVNVFRVPDAFIIALTYQQRMRVGEERARGRLVRTQDSREEISAFRAERRA